MENSVWFICLLGIGIVFLGLVSIVILCSTVSFLCKKLMGNETKETPAVYAPAPTASAAPTAPAAVIANRAKIVAAVSAVIAEELGEDVSAIRIKSLKRI